MKYLALEEKGIIYTTEDSIQDLVKNKQLEIVLNQYATSSTGLLLVPNTSVYFFYTSHFNEN